MQVFKRGLAKAIGVSNFNSSHIQEIIDAGLPLPSVNQVSFSPFHNLVSKPCNPAGDEGVFVDSGGSF